MWVIHLPHSPEKIAVVSIAVLLLVTALVGLAYCCCCCCCYCCCRRNESRTTTPALLGGNAQRGCGRCRCWQKRPASETRDFATLNDLLLEVDEHETGWLTVISVTPTPGRGQEQQVTAANADAATHQSRWTPSLSIFFQVKGKERVYLPVVADKSCRRRFYNSTFCFLFIIHSFLPRSVSSSIAHASCDRMFSRQAPVTLVKRTSR